MLYIYVDKTGLNFKFVPKNTFATAMETWPQFYTTNAEGTAENFFHKTVQ